MSLRGIQRTFGVCYETVRRWLGGENRATPGVCGHALAQRKR